MNGIPSNSKDLADITNIIPPKLIRNYDVYIVLKHKDNDKTEENITTEQQHNLIDFDTDTSSGKICDISPKTEEDSKKELNIIDVYKNIAVSPLTLSYQNESIDNVIFDPLELKNTNETTETHDSNDKYAALRDLETENVDIALGAASNSIINVEVHRKDYCLKELHNFDLKEDFTFPKLKLTHEADEDLIDEVLSTNVQRLSINNEKYGFNHNKTNVYNANSEEKNVSLSISDNEKFDIPKIIRTERQFSLTPEIEIHKRNNLGAIPKTNKVDLKSQMSLPLNDTINKGLDFKIKPKMNNVGCRPTPKNTIKTDNKQYVLPKQFFDKPQTAEQIRRHIDHLLKSKTKYCNVLNYYNPKDFYTTLHTNEDEFLIETVQLDPKKYRQRRITVEDSVAATYTKGPSLDEKKLVLPQMMDRLLNKKKRMERFADCKPKLILDCGSLRKKEIPVKLNPVVLTEDCNKDRLKNFKMRQNFDNFVRGGLDRAE